jgi:hypothetical protein
MAPKKLRLHAKETDHSRPWALPRPNKPGTPQGTTDPVADGEMLGDQRVFTDELRELDNSGQPTGPVVGEHDGHCTLVRKGPGNQRIYQCFATYRLAGGLITARTLFDLNNIPAGGIVAAVTGGTLDYSKARGQLTATFPGGDVVIYEIDLD